MKQIKILLALIVFSFALISCGNEYTPEQEAYIKGVEQARQAKDDYFKNSPNSPFNSGTKVEFHPLNYYDVNPNFVFQSKLTEYPQKDTVSVYGTKGEERKAVRYGYLVINHNNKDYKINVYQSKAQNGQVYYSIWFTDKTTNKETYGVGRYLEFKLNPDPNHIYTIDFNEAFNPYCAYSHDYSCAIPTKEDYIDMAIEAGEKKFHD